MVSGLTKAEDENGRKPPPASLHSRILADLRDAIVSGAWPPGHRVPYEHELSATYGCSRMTVNKAMTQLVDSGLIERRRRAGSFVRQPRLQSAVLQIREVRAQVAAPGLAYRYEIGRRRLRRGTRADAAWLGLAGVEHVLEVRCIHFAGTRVFCVEHRVINLVAVPAAAEASFETEAPGPWLVRVVPWTTAEHRISAATADAALAEIAHVPEGTPCLVIERHTWRAEEPVTAVRLTYPGAAHELVARFSPTDG